VLKDGDEIWDTLGEEFFFFFPQKTWIGKRYGVLLEML
jgi:hypothetical protein